MQRGLAAALRQASSAPTSSWQRAPRAALQQMSHTLLPGSSAFPRLCCGRRHFPPAFPLWWYCASRPGQAVVDVVSVVVSVHLVILSTRRVGEAVVDGVDLLVRIVVFLLVRKDEWRSRPTRALSNCDGGGTSPRWVWTLSWLRP